jgi:hypothetical protein
MPLVESRRMAILAECDICGNQHRVKDGLAGGTIRCSDCGVKIAVRRDQVITPEAFVEEGGRLRRREPQRGPSVWTWLVAVFVAVAVLIALTASIWFFLRIVQPTPGGAQFSAELSSIVITRMDFSKSRCFGVTESA